MERTIWAREKDPATNQWTAYFDVEAPGRRNSHLKGPFKLNIKGQWVTLRDNGIPATTIDQAKKLRDKYDAAQDAKAKGVELSADSGDGKPLKLAIREFLDIKKRKSPSTVENYTFILQQFLEYMLSIGVRFVEQINRKVIGQYIDWLEKDEYAPKTIENKTMVVVFMLKDAGVEEPYTKFNIGDLLPIVEEEPAEPYSQSDLKKLFSEMNSEECVRYTFFLVTACREKEVAHARWEDMVTDSDGKPHYRVRAKEYIGSNGQKTKFSPKNHEQRMIPITKELVDMLTKRKKESKSEWIFPNEDGFPEGHFLRKFKRIAFRAGLNCGTCDDHEISTGRNRAGHAQAGQEAQKKQVSCANGPYCEDHYLHRLRKTRATAWHREHVDLRTIQAYLGHKSLETTQKYLGISSAAAVEDKINKPMF